MLEFVMFSMATFQSAASIWYPYALVIAELWQTRAIAVMRRENRMNEMARPTKIVQVMPEQGV